MPKMDGIKATSMIKQFNPSLPIVAQTAYALDTDKEKYGSLFEDYLTKPVSKDKMMKIIHTFCN